MGRRERDPGHHSTRRGSTVAWYCRHFPLCRCKMQTFRSRPLWSGPAAAGDAAEPAAWKAAPRGGSMRRGDGRNSVSMNPQGSQERSALSLSAGQRRYGGIGRRRGTPPDQPHGRQH